VRRCIVKKKSVVLLGALMALGLMLAGCGSPITAEEIVAKMQETVENTEDAHAVVAVDMNAQGIELSVKAQVWEKAPNKIRAEVIEASDAQFAGAVMVTDGQTAWAYEPLRNVVTVGGEGDVEMPLPQETIASLQESIQELLDASEVELVGEERVAGNAAYVLRAIAKEGTTTEFYPGDGTATLWVDRDRWIVLKATYEAGSFGQATMEVESFDLNTGLADDLFAFEIPDGATVIDVEARRPQHLTLDEARAEAAFGLAVPDYVPGGATLIEVFRIGDSFVLRYDHSTQVSFTIVQGPELASPPPLGQAQEITVRGQDATVITDQLGGNTFLYWTEDDVTTSVAGHISLDEALMVAESLER
jgi:outer membrane lipoprotein-sorting protein